MLRGSIVLFACFITLIVVPLPTNAAQPAETVDAATPASAAKTCRESFSRGSTEEFNKKCIALAGALAAMRGETLVIRMDDGSRKIFDNKESSGATAGAFGYGLADFYPSTHIFVICDFGPDSGTSTVVDGRTGRPLYSGDAFPYVSPDGNWLLAVEYSAEANSDFSVLDVRGKKPLVVWTSKASKARLPAKADFVAWEDDKTIKLASPGRKPVFLVRADDGSWGLRSTPAH